MYHPDLMRNVASLHHNELVDSATKHRLARQSRRAGLHKKSDRRR